jgi:hypothetical protein
VEQKKQTKQENTERVTGKKWRTIYFRNHLPIRIKGEWNELWLGYVYSDFGSRDIRSYKNQKGEYLLWYRFTSPYDNVKSYSQYIGKFRPGEGVDIMDKIRNFREYYGDGVIGDNPFSITDLGKIQVYLDGLGLSKVEEF